MQWYSRKNKCHFNENNVVRWEKQVAKQKSVPKQWDILTKMLMQANPQDLVSWILPNAVYQGELNVELQKKHPIFADLLYTIKWRRKKVVLHVEIQRRRHAKMDRRVWEYNCLTSIHAGLPVYSVVISLLQDSPIVDPPYEMKLPTGFTVHRFFFENIKLWEVPPEVLKQQKLSGLLPLLPLTKDGKSPEAVDEMIGCLQQTGKADLLPLAYALSALTFNKEEEQQWLKERFESMTDILEESWAYQEMVQKGVAKGLEQGLKQGLERGLERGLKRGLKKEKKGLEHIVVRFVELHFPDLVPLAKRQAAKTTTSEQLQDMLDKLFVVHTDHEARAVLLGEG
jgi:predicted transposase YdaD